MNKIILLPWHCIATSKCPQTVGNSCALIFHAFLAVAKECCRSYFITGNNLVGEKQTARNVFSRLLYTLNNICLRNNKKQQQQKTLQAIFQHQEVIYTQ